MPLEPSDYYRLMRDAYKTGLMQRLDEMTAEVLSDTMAEMGLGTYDLIDALDQTDPSGIDDILERMSPRLARLIAHPWLMKAAGNLLNLKIVKSLLVSKTSEKLRLFLLASMEGSSEASR